MGAFGAAALLEPVESDNPCGPDLDFEGDNAFLNFMARAEGILPAAYTRINDQGAVELFDRTSINFANELQAIAKFTADTRDLRLLVLAAKLQILNRDLAGFAETLDGIVALLRERWEDVHPRGEGGDFMLRSVVLQTLDDRATVFQPLQYQPILNSRRHGTINYRQQMIAAGEIQAREGEEPLDATTIESAFAEVEIPTLVATRDLAKTIHDSLVTLRDLWLEKAGYDQAIAFEQLTPMMAGMLAFLDKGVGQRDPALALGATAPVGDGPAPPMPATSGAGAPQAVALVHTSIASLDEAQILLRAVLKYFVVREPASPAGLFLKQAHALIGKSFLDVLQVLFPADYERAMVRLGGPLAFELPLERIASHVANTWDASVLGEEGDAPPAEEPAADPYGYYSYDTPSDAEADTTDTASDDAAAPPDAEESGEEPASDEMSDVEASELTGADAEPESAKGAAGSAANAQDGAKQAPIIATRTEAVAAMHALAEYFRAAEPANPVPLLLDKACALAHRDFISLISDIIPGVAKRPDESSGY